MAIKAMRFETLIWAGGKPMSTTLIETIKEQLAALTPQEQAEVWQFLTEHLKAASHPTPPTRPEEDIEVAETRRRKRMEWMKAHDAEFSGQYVALDGDHLVGLGRTFREAKEVARATGHFDVFVTLPAQT